MMMLVNVALAVDQQRELAQRPVAYASPLAFKWQPQTPSGHDLPVDAATRILQSGHSPLGVGCRDRI